MRDTVDIPDASDEPSQSASSAAWTVVAAAWACLIFAASSFPGSAIPGRFGPVAHFLEYAVFAGLLGIALWRRHGRAGALLLALSIACAYAATDELHQAFVVMRTPDVVDWLVDLAGATAGAASAVSISRRRSERPS